MRSPVSWLHESKWTLASFTLAMVICFSLSSSGLFRFPEGWFYDLAFFLRGEEAPRSPIVLIAIDEDSVRERGRFTRRTYAQLVETLSSQGAEVIALDILLDTPSVTDDPVLAEAIARAGNVVLAGHFDLQRTPLGLHESWRPPVKSLLEFASGIGFTNLPQESDGIIRSAILARTLGRESFLSLTAEVVRVYQKSAPDAPVNQPLLINYRGGPFTFETISAHRLLSDSDDLAANLLAGKIALVGYTTKAEKDLFSTPYTRSPDPAERGLLSGVELQANIIGNLLQDDFLQAASPWQERGLMALLGILGAVLALRISPIYGLLLLIALVFFYSSAAFSSMAFLRLSLPGVSPAATSLIVFGALLTQRTIFEEREKRRIRGLFSGFISPDRLETLLGYREDLWRHRKGVDATVLFVDIRGFSVMVEEMMGQGKEGEVVEFLNTYLNTTVREVVSQGGTVERLMGDGLLAVFGAPVPHDQHALQAVRAAQGIARSTEMLQESWPLASQNPLALGIGIHSGYILEVVLGSSLRYEYTIVGSVVNTAAHIQAYAKNAEFSTGTGTVILLTKETFERASTEMELDAECFEFQAEGKGTSSEIVYLLKDIKTP